MDFFEEWDEADWHLTYVDEEEPDKSVLQGGLVIMLYLLKSYTPENRRALASILRRLQGVMGEHLQWGYWEHPKRKKGKYSPGRFDEFVEWVRKRPPTHAIEFTWSSGPGYDHVGSFGFDAFSQMNLKEEEWKSVSHLRIYLPVDVLREEGLQMFETLVQELASGLPVLHGHVGLGIQQCNEYHRYENLEYELVEQFLGFEVGSILDYYEMRGGIKTVSWYTILHRSWLEKLGGREGLERAISEESANGLSLLDFANGVIVKAGEWPSLGWVENDPQPAPYVAANRILKPVRVPELRSIHMGSILGEVRFNDATSNLWLRRFDEPGIWPHQPNRPAHLQSAGNQEDAPPPEPQAPPLKVQTLRAYPGQPCPASGEWRSPFLNRTVNMRAGDIMPGPETTQRGGVTWYMDRPLP